VRPSRELRVAFRYATGALRMLPDFIIAGAQRAGTTSLYRYLAGHPAVVPASRKEVHFFDLAYHRGLWWYRAHFPLRTRRTASGAAVRTGEASPYYMFHPHAPRRIAAALPRVKLVVLLRNPIDRAFSQYHHEVRHGHETLSFPDALDREGERLAAELPRLLADPRAQSFAHQHHSYAARGFYARQLGELRRAGFDEGRLMILPAEAFFADPAPGFARLVDFLGLLRWRPPGFARFNALHYGRMESPLRERLRAVFAEPNRELYELLGQDLGWR
jgi:hypothetical protein